MANYPNNEVEREVRSRVNGAMEELVRKRDSEHRELAASEYAPGPGMGSGPYEQMRVGVSVSFYETLFQKIVDSWVDVLTRQSGKINAGDVNHVVQELETRASAAPTHIRRALASRGTTAHLFPPGAMKALEDGARQRMKELVAKHRRELQTRLYNQDHPHPKEVAPEPNINITKINSDNTNSTVTSGHGNKITPDTNKKGWWETWWGVVVTSVIAGLIIWGITRYFDTPKSVAPGNPQPHQNTPYTPPPPAALLFTPPDLEGHKWNVSIRALGFPEFEAQGAVFRANHTYEFGGNFLVKTEAANQYIDCPSNVSGKWNYANYDHTQMRFDMKVSGIAGRTPDEYAQCSQTLAPLVSAQKKAFGPCKFLNAALCKSVGLEIHLSR